MAGHLVLEDLREEGDNTDSLVTDDKPKYCPCDFFHYGTEIDLALEGCIKYNVLLGIDESVHNLVTQHGCCRTCVYELALVYAYYFAKDQDDGYVKRWEQLVFPDTEKFLPKDLSRLYSWITLTNKRPSSDKTHRALRYIARKGIPIKRGTLAQILYAQSDSSNCRNKQLDLLEMFKLKWPDTLVPNEYIFLRLDSTKRLIKLGCSKVKFKYHFPSDVLEFLTNKGSEGKVTIDEDLQEFCDDFVRESRPIERYRNFITLLLTAAKCQEDKKYASAYFDREFRTITDKTNVVNNHRLCLIVELLQICASLDYEPYQPLQEYLNDPETYELTKKFVSQHFKAEVWDLLRSWGSVDVKPAKRKRETCQLRDANVMTDQCSPVAKRLCLKT